MSWYKEKEIRSFIKKYKNTKLLHVQNNLRKTILITNNNINNKGL